MIEFFFDCSSPWTWLAFHNLQPIARELGVEVPETEYARLASLDKCVAYLAEHADR